MSHEHYETQEGVCYEEPRIHWDKSKNKWVTDDATCWTDQGRFIYVPAGFETDLATIPNIFRPVWQTYGKHNRAVIVHDWFYKHRGKLPDGNIFTRQEADRIMFDIMKADGVSWFYRSSMWLAVRVSPTNIFQGW